MQDEGIGIDQKEISKIFTPFYVNKTAYAPQSNGVGLSLTKKLVTLHKGDIQVESSIGEGSRFTVLIPIDRNYYPEIKDIIETSEIPSTVPNEATEDTEEKEDTILLVDDNEEFLLLMKRKLATHYNILTATNGKKALEIVRQHPVLPTFFSSIAGTLHCHLPIISYLLSLLYLLLLHSVLLTVFHWFR